MDKKYETVTGRENNKKRKKKISGFTLWRISWKMESLDQQESLSKASKCWNEALERLGEGWGRFSQVGGSVTAGPNP